MSTETTKKKIKIDNGTEFARVMTDKTITSELAKKQDTLVSGTNIKTINGNSLLGSGDLAISGGSAEGVSPTLWLLNASDFTKRTTITEKEKINLTQGLYNQVMYGELINDAVDEIYSPSKVIVIDDSNIFFVILDGYTGSGKNFSITTMSLYQIEIGTKNTSGEYPITITKQMTFNLGNGGESVSPTLYLIDVDSLKQRTTITEQEKLNLEKGLYNQILWNSSDEYYGEFAFYLPSKLMSSGGTNMFALMDVSGDESPYVKQIEFYFLEIGEKNADGEYPITIKSAEDNGFPNIPFGDYKSINLFGKHSILVPNASTDTEINLYNHFIKITGNASEVESGTNIIARFTIQSSNNLVVDSLTDLYTLLGNEFEIGCSGLFGENNLTGLRKTTEGVLELIYNNGGAESLQNVAGLTISISDKVKTV